MTSNTLKINKFNLSKIKPTDNILIIGRRQTGKSVLIKNILHSLNHKINGGIVISLSEQLKNEYKYFPDKLVHDNYTPELIKEYLKNQKQNVLLYNESQKFGIDTNHGENIININPYNVCVIDDSLYTTGDFKNSSIKHLIYNGRHIYNMNILSITYPMTIPVEIRREFDYVFILKDNKTIHRKNIHKQYANFIPSFDDFSNIMEKLTNQYECMVIDNKTYSTKIEDNIFWYKGSLLDDFKFGNHNYWKLQSKYKFEIDKYHSDNVVNKILLDYEIITKEDIETIL